MDPDRARELLQQHRMRIQKALSGLEPNDGGEVSDLPLHLADGAEHLHSEELDAGIAEILRQELAAIERAEERLEAGTYGLSVESGEPIPDPRLEAIPWAERTAAEQARYERSGLGR
jgi:DnaK suppressor protein